jgi:mRNA-degrading endonuclease RelE of RelBE toxin-antitoxin system
MPFTKDKYLVRENPHLVQWERECRKFLRNLSPEHGHRVSAVMIYEWATGILMVDVMKDQQKFQPGKQNWRSDLRKINKVLEFYFGKPYMTYIMGRKVPKAYRVRPGYYIRRHRPLTLTLYAEYVEGVLYP